MLAPAPRHQRLSAWALNNWDVRRVIALSLLLLSPALFSGFMGDDLFHYVLLNDGANFPQKDDLSLFHLFSFIDDNPIRRQQLQDMSIMSWWISPTFTWNFWRPLAELSHYIDYVWLTPYPWLMHAQSLGYFVLIILLFQRCLSFAFTSPAMVLLATAIFALSATHGMTVAWLSNRNALLAALFGLCTLYCHMSSRYNAQQQLNAAAAVYYAMALFSLCLCLLSGEIVLSIGVFLFAYAVCFDKSGPIKAVIILLPYLVIVMIWWSIYQYGGFGAHGNTLFYINPSEHPLTFIQLLSQRIPLIILALISALPVDIIGNIPVLTAPLITLSLLLIVASARLLKHSVYKKMALASTIAMVLAILPIACSPPQSRNLLFVSMPSAVLIAIILHALYLQLEQQTAKKSVKVAFYTLLSLHLIFSPLLLIPSAYIPKMFSSGAEKRAKTFNVNSDDQVVVFSADMMEMSYLSGNLFIHNKTIPQRIWNLTGSESHFTLQVINEHRLRLSADTAFVSSADQLVRNLEAEPFTASDSIQLNGLEIIIVATNPQGQPTIIETRFDKKLSQLRFLRWRTSGYEELDINALDNFHFQ